MNAVPDEPRTDTAPPPGPGHGRAIVLFTIALLIAWFSSMHGDYVLDDARITNNPDIERPFATDLRVRPVISVSLTLNYLFDGLNQRGYHALNLAVHFLAGLFLYDLVRRTLLLPRFDNRFERTAGWIGLVTGIVWMVHPLNTQSVTYVIQRCESFMGMFFLGSLWCYVCGAAAERGRWWWVAAFFMCALGAGCKEMMVVLAPLAWLYDRTFITGSWRESLRRRGWVLFSLLIPPVGGLAALFISGFFTEAGSSVGFGVKLYTPYTYALTQTTVILHYLKLSFVPVGLALDCLDWPACRSIKDCWASAAAIAAIVLVTGLGVVIRAAWAFPAAWFLACLAPSSTFVPVQDTVFEHRMYLPLVGVVVLTICGAACLLVTRVPGWLLAAVAVPLILVLSLLTAARNEDYATTQRILQDNVDKRPGNARARMNLAIQMFAFGDYAGAEEQLRIAKTLPLQGEMLRKQLIGVLRETGRPGEAVEIARELVAEAPDSYDANYELGMLLLADSRTTEALPYLLKTLEIAPEHKFAHGHLGMAYLELGQTAKAEAEFKATRTLDPEYARALELAARRIANDPEAKPSNKRLALMYSDAAIRLTDAPSAEWLDTLAMCQARMEKFDDAAKTAIRAAAAARAHGDEYLAGRYEIRAARFRERKQNLPDTKP